MQEYYDERSEQWSESERGEDFAERLEAVQEVLEQVAELAPEPPPKKTENPSNTLDGPPRLSCSAAVSRLLSSFFGNIAAKANDVSIVILNGEFVHARVRVQL